VALVTAVVSTGPAAGNASAGGNARPAGAPALSDLLLKGSQVYGLGYARGRPRQLKVTAEDIALCRVMGTPGQVEAVLDLNRAVFNPGGVQTSDDVIELLLQTATPKEAELAPPAWTSVLRRCSSRRGVLMPAARPPEFRRRAVELARQKDKPVAVIAADLGISESCLRRWMGLADVAEGTREGPRAGEREELVRLRKELRVARMEVEILKRASAYFARENVLPKE